MEKIFIWGTGTIAEQVLEQCDVFGLYDVMGFIDNNKDKSGEFFHGREIFTADILGERKADRIVILTIHYKEIEKQIRRMFPEITADVEEMNFFYKQNVMKRYRNSRDPQIVGILERLENHDLHVFNYEFMKKYEEMCFQIEFDALCGMYFANHKGKRLYFSKSLKSREEATEYYRGILMEQDQKSPHKYIEEEFDIEKDDVVIDVGAAEGNFSLQVIDRVSKLYIIEADVGWIEALRVTFRDYMDKVVIFNKFITSLDSGKYATLDALIEEPVNFIKMDIEGNEWDALQGAGTLIDRSENLKCAVCAYHGDFDEILIRDILGKYGMDISTTQGYMWYPDTNRQTYVSTRLCRGIVRGIKNKSNREGKPEWED
ncbi:MAG: FkbM family methyltransferase [Lachnospiraceae bacterium]|nr:FkbM family methyltransferase [Lachnospiraceae bacterium]